MPAYISDDSSHTSNILKVICLAVVAPLALAGSITAVYFVSAKILDERAGIAVQAVIDRQDKRIKDVVARHNTHDALYTQLLAIKTAKDYTSFTAALKTALATYRASIATTCKSDPFSEFDSKNQQQVSKLQYTNKQRYDAISKFGFFTEKYTKAANCAPDDARLVVEGWLFNYLTATLTVYSTIIPGTMKASDQETKQAIADLNLTDKQFANIKELYGNDTVSFLKYAPVAMDFMQKSFKAKTAGEINALANEMPSEMKNYSDTSDKAIASIINIQSQQNKKLLATLKDRYAAVDVIAHNNKSIQYTRDSWLIELLPVALAQYAIDNENSFPVESSARPMLEKLREKKYIDNIDDFSSFAYTSDGTKYTLSVEIKGKQYRISDRQSATVTSSPLASAQETLEL